MAFLDRGGRAILRCSSHRPQAGSGFDARRRPENDKSLVETFSRFMPRIDRYVLRELSGTFAASAIVLVLVSLSGIIGDLLNKISRGKVPAGLLLSQLGLRALDILPLLLPLALFLGVLLAYGRLYRDSEMAVLASAGLGIRRLARPLTWIAVPVAIIVGLTSLWLAPAALETSKVMIDAANRSLLVAGLEAGRFVEIPGRQSVVYLAEMEPDGSRFRRLFVHSESDGRVDVVTAAAGELYQESQGDERYLSLTDGFRVEGELGKDAFRIMRFKRNDIRVPDSEQSESGRAEERISSYELWSSDQASARAELHWRIGAPLATLILAVLALPLAHSPPRSARYGRILVALLGYIVYLNLLALGRAWMADGTMPGWLGLWWVHGPALAIALWLLWKDEHLPRPRGASA
jgi:lipopolysaccharide export system permease protein